MSTLRSLHRRGRRFPFPRPSLAAHFDDENGVLAAERDEQDEADLGVEIVGGADEVSADGAEERERHAEDTASGRIQLSYWPASTK